MGIAYLPRISTSTVGSRENFQESRIQMSHECGRLCRCEESRPCCRRGRVELFQRQHWLKGRSLVRRPWLVHRLAVYRQTRALRVSMWLPIAQLGVRPVVLDCRRRLSRVELVSVERSVGKKEEMSAGEKWQDSVRLAGWGAAVMGWMDASLLLPISRGR
jgi:hypothetical protein